MSTTENAIEQPSQETASATRVLLVEEQNCVRSCIKLTLQKCGHSYEWFECSLGQEAIELCKKHKPHVMLLDLGLPDMSGVEVMRRLQTDGIQVNTLIHTGSLSRETLFAALRCAPLGFVEKTADLEELRMGFERVTVGEVYFTSYALELLREAAGKDVGKMILSDREIEVLRLLALGNPAKSVAAQLNVSPRTVETHRANIMRKLGYHDITALTRYAVRESIISADAG
jgi:DNA-binding NarL/FixJ family response regulator